MSIQTVKFSTISISSNACNAYMESLKFPTIPGVSPGVGWRKQGLLALQMIPCIQGNVPAEGMALFGKWPGIIEQRNQILKKCVKSTFNEVNK